MRLDRLKTVVLGATAALFTTGLLTLASPAMAATTPDGHFDYTLSGTTATITDFHPGSPAVTDVIIPSTIEDGGNPYTVTTIGDNAFSFNNLTTVTIPGSVTTIGYRAFFTNSLTTVTIPDSVTTIGEDAFRRNSLINVTIPGSVTTIGESAFAFNSLTSVTIPGSVTTIELGTFNSNALTSITIPDSVTTIGESAFYDNALSTVTIPGSVTTIGDYAFYGNVLTTVTIPDSVTTIGDAAFYFNLTLTSAVFDGNAPSMGTNVLPGAVSGFTVFYFDGATGFTNPWLSYPTQVVNPAGSTLILSLGDPVPADGSHSYSATLTVRDGTPGATVAGFPARFAIPSGVSASATDCVTDTNGACTITLTSTTAGTYAIGALLGTTAPSNLTASASFAALAPTGADIGPVPFVIGGALLVLGVILTMFTIRRRKR